MNKTILTILMVTVISCVWFSNYVTPLGFTVSTIMGIFAIIIVVLKILKDKKLPLSRDFLHLMVISISLFFWAAFVYLINDAYPVGFRRLGQIALGISISFATYFAISSQAEVAKFVSCLLIGTFVSALVAIGQHYIGEPFVSLWLALGERLEGRIDTVRVLAPGLAPTSILLGYQLATVMPIAIAWKLSCVRLVSRRWRLFFIVMLVAMGLGLIFSGSRSAVAAAVFGGATTWLMMRLKRIRWYVVLIVAGLLTVTMYTLVGNFYAPTRFIELRDISAATRPALALAAVRYAVDNPFGTGLYVTPETYLPIQLDPRVAEAVLSLTPHNQFLNILTYYGFPGLVLLIAFYWVILHHISWLWRFVGQSDDNGSKWIAAGLAGSTLAYLLNSLFHNAGPFVGDWFYWFFIGIIFSTCRVAIRNKCDLIIHLRDGAGQINVRFFGK